MWRCKAELVLLELGGRAGQCVEHMERMEEDQLMKRIVGSRVRGVRLKGRSRIEWMEVVKRALKERGMFVEQGRMIMCDRRFSPI